MLIEVPMSVGELVDKWTILSIKSERIKDTQKLENIRTEKNSLEATAEKNGVNLSISLVSKLKSINEELWDIEDDIRVQESKAQFGEEFIRLARAVYVTNDKRFHAKSDINEHFGSSLREEKSYEDYSHTEQ